MEFEKIYQGLNLQELENKLHRLDFQMDISFTEIVKEIYRGEGKGILLMIWDKCRENVVTQVQGMKDIFITVVIIVLISAVFSSLKGTFQNAQIAEISFYINYLLLIIIFTNIFGNVLNMGEETLKDIEDFMRIFFPTFFLLVGSTIGVGTGMAYYQIAGGAIYLVEWCLVSILLPSISAYMLFVIMNGIWEEERLTLLLELIQKGIRLLLKITLGVLTGAGMIQSMISPIMDRVKGESIYKIVEGIPGIGDIAEGTLRIWLGSAVLIKNSVGIVGCVFLVFLCMIPVLKIFTIGCFLKITAAILGIVGDKKMIACTNQVGDGVFMVFQTVGYGILFFVVLIALTIYTTGGF